MPVKLISWNVNGLRAIVGKNFTEAFEALEVPSWRIVCGSVKPLKAITWLGFSLLAVGGVTFLVLLILLLCGVNGGLWWLAMLMTLLTGCVLTALGIVGEYIARIYDEALGRPLYVAAETLGFDEEA